MSNQLMELEQTLKNQLILVEEMRSMKDDVSDMKVDMDHKFEQTSTLLKKVSDSITVNEAECLALQSIVGKQGQVFSEIDFVLDAFIQGTPIFKDMTDKFPTIESFIGGSILETADGLSGYTTQGENGETIFIQFFSEGKRLNTYLKNSKVMKQQFLVINKDLDTPTKCLDHVSKLVQELKTIQKELDELEEE
ncbi:hypothetical protein DTPHA_1401337 [Enterococcus faecium]|nr:hypothetical protein DTPHA_1401337 [Enterococcus faecium]